RSSPPFSDLLRATLLALAPPGMAQAPLHHPSPADRCDAPGPEGRLVQQAKAAPAISTVPRRPQPQTPTIARRHQVVQIYRLSSIFFPFFNGHRKTGSSSKAGP